MRSTNLKRSLKINTKDYNDRTLLCYAAQSGSEPAHKYCSSLDIGPDARAKDNEGIALYFGIRDEAIVKLLVGLVLYINEKDEHGPTALH